MNRRDPRPIQLLAATALSGAALLTGCATSAPAPQSGGGVDDSGTSATDGAASASEQPCSKLKDPEYGLFLDPSLTVEPALDIYPLQSESDTIHFTYTGDLGADPGFSFETYYITPEGKVSPQGGVPAFDVENGVFSTSGPHYTAGLTGGPHEGVLEVSMIANARFDDETQSYTADTSVLARLCMLFAE